MNWDYTSISNELKTRLSYLSNWSTILYQGVYQKIISAISYIFEKLAYTVEYYFKESKWNLATRRESLIPICDLLRYVPHRKTGAFGAILLSGDSTFSTGYAYTGNSVLIPQWTTFSDTSGLLNVYCFESINYIKGYIGNLTIPIKEGVPKSYSYTATGTPYESFSIFSDSIDNEEVYIYLLNLDGSINSEITKLRKNELYFLNSPADYYCEVYTAEDFQSVIFKFGDGVHAKQLTSGQSILIRYAETKGALGNISQTGVINTITTSLVDNNNGIATLYVTNQELISDGADNESVQEIKLYAPRVFASTDKGGTLLDYTTLIENHPFVAKAKVWGATDIGDYTESNAKKVYFTAISNTGDALSNSQITEIKDFFKTRKSVTEQLFSENLEIIFIGYDLNLFCYTGNTKVEIDTAVYQAINNVYGILSVDFKTDVYLSNIISLIQQLSFVKHLKAKLYYMEYNLPYALATHRLNGTLIASEEIVLKNQVLLSVGSVELWIQQKIAGVWSSPEVIGLDDGVGHLNGVGAWVITNNLIDYANALLQYNVETIQNNIATYGVQNPQDADPDGYILSIKYTTEAGDGSFSTDIRLPKFFQITDTLQIYGTTTVSYI